MPNVTDALRRNIAEVESRIQAAAARAGRRREEITLVAVTKTVPAVTVIEAVALGLGELGENRLEDAEGKVREVEAGLAARGAARPVWHIVGHVQSRKALGVAGLFDWVQSVDSVRLASRLSAARGSAVPPLRVLLEINTSGEASKYGLSGHIGVGSADQRQKILEVARSIARIPNLSLEGLMTLGPLGGSPSESRRAFSLLRSWLELLQGEVPEASWQHLSMGMTDDFEAAIEQGATMIRLGRALFRMEPASG